MNDLTARWPRGVVPYEIDSSMTPVQNYGIPTVGTSFYFYHLEVWTKSKILSKKQPIKSAIERTVA